MAYTTILFDLDGTLTDSKEGIFKSLRHAFDTLQVPCPSDDILRCFIGPPMPDSLRRYGHLSDAQVQEAMVLFRQRYSAIGKFENTPAPGMLALCQQLHAAGYQLALASSKPEVMCVDICEKFGFAPYLHVIAGAALDEHNTKADVIRDAMSRLGVTDASTVLMIGDREFDVLGAKECGVDSVGVAFFGYAAEGELERAGAKAVFTSTQDLATWIMG